MVSWERRSHLVSWERRSKTSVSQQLFLVSYPWEKVRETLLYLQRCTFLFRRRLHPFFRLLHAVRRSSSVFPLVYSPPSVVNRLPLVVCHRLPVIFSPSSDRTSPPLNHDISTEVRTSTLIERFHHLSSRELCNVLSSAGLKKTTPSPSSLGSI